MDSQIRSNWMDTPCPHQARAVQLCWKPKSFEPSFPVYLTGTTEVYWTGCVVLGRWAPVLFLCDLQDGTIPPCPAKKRINFGFIGDPLDNCKLCHTWSRLPKIIQFPGSWAKRILRTVLTPFECSIYVFQCAICCFIAPLKPNTLVFIPSESSTAARWRRSLRRCTIPMMQALSWTATYCSFRGAGGNHGGWHSCPDVRKRMVPRCSKLMHLSWFQFGDIAWYNACMHAYTYIMIAFL